MFKKGVYAATISIINKDYSLNVEETVKHAEGLIKNGLHGVFFFGSTGQSQLISSDEKKVLISKIASHKMRKNFFLGTGSNSLKENLDLIKYGLEFDFNTFLIMPPAYYKSNSDTATSDSFTFKTYDGELYSESVEVAINIIPVNDAPVATPLIIEAKEQTSIKIKFSRVVSTL